MGRDDPIADREAEAGPYTDTFGGEAWVEDARQLILRDSFAGVLELEDDLRAFGPGADVDPALAVDRLHGVGQQVHEDLIQLVREAADERELSVALHQLDAIFQLVLNQAERALDAFVQIDLFDL